MAEPTQFTFDLKEVTEALVRKQELKEGKWTISFEMTLSLAHLVRIQKTCVRER